MAGPALPAGFAVRVRRSARGPGAQLLIALWGAGLVLFNFPMLVVFDRDVTVLGLPLLPVALFAIWALLIALLAWAMERGGDRSDPRDQPKPDLIDGLQETAPTFPANP